MVRGLLAKLIALVLLVGVGSTGLAQQSGLPLQEGVPLNANVFATDINFPVGLVILPDDSLLVGSSNPTDGSYFSSTGEVLRLHDVDADGVADGPPEVVASGLAGAVTAVAVGGKLVFVTSVEYGRERIQILRAPEDWSGPYEHLGDIVFTFTNFAHQSYGLATRPSPETPGAVELYFNIGASGNEDGGRHVPVGGLLQTRLADSSLYMSVVTDTGDGVEVSEPVQIATGLRNAMAFAFHPETGDLWITDNGIDGLEDVWSSYSADELNVIPADQIGGEVEDFGFPNTYTLYETGEIVGQKGVQPVVAFVPTDGAENEGISSMAFTPPGFSAFFGTGVVVGFHGQWDQWGPDNEENALLFVDLQSQAVSTLVPPGVPGVGHLDSLASSSDAIYVADMCTGSSLANADPCGVIYRITLP